MLNQVMIPIVDQPWTGKEVVNVIVRMGDGGYWNRKSLSEDLGYDQIKAALKAPENWHVAKVSEIGSLVIDPAEFSECLTEDTKILQDDSGVIGIQIGEDHYAMVPKHSAAPKTALKSGLATVIDLAWDLVQADLAEVATFLFLKMKVTLRELVDMDGKGKVLASVMELVGTSSKEHQRALSALRVVGKVTHDKDGFHVGPYSICLEGDGWDAGAYGEVDLGHHVTLGAAALAVIGDHASKKVGVE